MYDQAKKKKKKKNEGVFNKSWDTNTNMIYLLGVIS